MTWEKLHKLFCSQVDNVEKTRQLWLWKQQKVMRSEEKFLLAHVSNHKMDVIFCNATFWWQVNLKCIAFFCFIEFAYIAFSPFNFDIVDGQRRHHKVGSSFGPIGSFLEIREEMSIQSLQSYVSTWENMLWSDFFSKEFSNDKDISCNSRFEQQFGGIKATRRVPARCFSSPLFGMLKYVLIIVIKSL